MKKKIFLLILVVVILILPSLVPLFNRQFFRMHDFTHVARLVEMDTALKDGHFPPRLSRNLGWGYGMPLFHFYGPLPYFIGEVFHLLGFNFLNAVKIVFGLSFFLAFGGMFLLARKFWGFGGGFLAALAFVYSPYRSVDFYVRGSLGELFAISLIPWVLWLIIQVIDKKGKRIIGWAGLTLSLFFLTHTILNLICLPLFLLFAFFYWLISKNKQKKTAFLRLIFTFVLGVGLAAFFLLPAFFEKKYSAVDKLIAGYSHYSHHFLYFRQFIWGNWGYAGSVDGIEDGTSFHLGKVHLGLSILTLVFSLIFIFKDKKISQQAWLAGFSIILVLSLASLSTYHAKPIWDTVPLMVFIQFPWRLNSFIIVLIGFLAGGGEYYLRKINKKIALIFLVLASLVLVGKNLSYFKPEKYVDPENDYYTDARLIRSAMSGVIPDYVPIWVKDQPETTFEDYQLIEGKAEIELIESKTQKLVLKVENQAEAKIQLNRFYFPGWQLYLDDQKAGFDYKDEDNNGIITFNLPSGKYVLKLVFENTPIRTVANMVSLMSLIGLAFLFKKKRFIKKEKKN